MRITFNSMYRAASAGIQSATERLVDLQRQVATGRKLDKPSDDPSGTSTAIAERATLANVEQYTRASTNVGSRLSVVDTLFSDIIDQIRLASTTALAARGTNHPQNQREASAQTLEGVKQTLLENFNTKFQGAYLLGGANAATPPFQKNASGTVLPYAGSTTEIAVDIDQNRSVRVSFNGDAIAKGSAATDIFAVMDDLVTAARSGDNDAIGRGTAELDAFLTRVVTAHSRVGADMNTIEDQKLRLAQAKLASVTRLQGVEAADPTEVIPAMNQAKVAYEAALGAASAVSRVSLMDYIR